MVKPKFDDKLYRNKPGWIYLVRAKGCNRYKIGLTTRTPQERLDELNGGQSPFPLSLIMTVCVKNVTVAEKYLHNKFSLNRVHNEWFEFPETQLPQVFAEFKAIGSKMPSLQGSILRSHQSYRQPPKKVKKLKKQQKKLGMEKLLTIKFLNFLEELGKWGLIIFAIFLFLVALSAFYRPQPQSESESEPSSYFNRSDLTIQI